MIEALAADRADEPLREGVLPRALGRGQHVPDSHAHHSVPKRVTGDAVPIAEEVGRRAVIREHLHDLLRGPGCGGMLGRVEVKDAPPMVGEDDEDDEDEQDAPPSGGMSNGYYTFRFICYDQTGVDGMGNPILVPAPMGLPGGVGRRCTTVRAELLTLYVHDDAHVPDCQILNFTKNGVAVVDECAMVTLTPADWLEVEYEAFDNAGNLDSYSVTLQKGFSPEQNLLGLAGVTAVSGSTPEGPTYGAALVDPTPAIPPYWFGGTWKKKIPYASFMAMGGSCAYNLRLTACDRHTNGFTSACSLAYCDKSRAFTIILAP